jgi:hypothetical protein
MHGGSDERGLLELNQNRQQRLTDGDHIRRSQPKRKRVCQGRRNGVAITYCNTAAKRCLPKAGPGTSETSAKQGSTASGVATEPSFESRPHRHFHQENQAVTKAAIKWKEATEIISFADLLGEAGATTHAPLTSQTHPSSPSLISIQRRHPNPSTWPIFSPRPCRQVGTSCP